MPRCSIQCRCVVAGTGEPVPDAICSISGCGRTACRYCDLFGVCEFCVPCGCYCVRCECTPRNVFPDPAVREVCVNCNTPDVAVEFECPLAP